MLQTDGADATTARRAAGGARHRPKRPFFFGLGGGAFFSSFFLPPKSPPRKPPPVSFSSTHPSSAYGARRSNRSPPSNSGMPIAIPGNDIQPFCPLKASLASSSALALFFALMAFISSFASVPFMKPLTLARRLLTSLSRFPPLRRLRRISCCCSYIGSRPSTSLLLSNHPARTTRFEARGFEVATGSRRSDRRSATARR
mmetsp:Transcript_8285/g.36640  ORF Transcript_8285/g.36640 Transcript_8285/m.36640 type:complete len:200 (-) Transcript_8285:33-632(-)